MVSVLTPEKRELVTAHAEARATLAHLALSLSRLVEKYGMV